MTSAKPFFNCPCRLSISMFLQNISPIGLFIYVLWLTKFFLSNFTHITQWKMSAPKIFFTSTWSMSISIVLQNFSPIRFFTTNGHRKCGGRKRTKKKKKSRQAHRGSRQGTGCPNYETSIQSSMSMMSKDTNCWKLHTGITGKKQEETLILSCTINNMLYFHASINLVISTLIQSAWSVLMVAPFLMA